MAEQDQQLLGDLPPLEPLSEWLDKQLDGPAKPILAEPLKGGSSNLLYKIHRGEDTFVLRRPPRVRYDKTSHNVTREIRLLTALRNTDVPHPRLIAASDSTDVIGSPFLIMSHVDGWSPVGKYPHPFENDLAARKEIGIAMIGGLAKMAAVDWRAVGLEGFGKPEGFLERQVDRWMGQLQRYQTRKIDHLSDVARWLETNRPMQYSTGLMHGDYSFPNVMLSASPPLRLAAILDWESCTIGDPLLDLGHLLAGWCDPDETATYLRDVNWRGMATREQLLVRYAKLTGASLDNIEYYRVLALFKLAIILEGAYARYKNGQNDYAPHATLKQRVPAFIKRAWKIAQVAN